MKPRRESNGPHGTWEAWSARAGRALARGPLSLADAQAAFDAASPSELDDSELEAICHAGVAIYGESLEREANPNATSGSHRSGPHHGLLHERLDRREMPTSLTMFAWPAEVTEMSTQFTPAAGAAAAEASWPFERHLVERASWQGTHDWTPQHEASADTGIAAHTVEWQDTLEIDTQLVLGGFATAFSPASSDGIHEAVFSHDGWLEAV
ncbi:MAG: hypothetical protein KF708_21800 [Pirellulales bacterium]|nr:hypothetical protein [Pirellulales bacterium]